MPVDDALLAAWRSRVERARTSLGWPAGQTVARAHAAGVSLAITAPPDQLLLATEINEWALCATLVERDPVRWSGLEAALVAAAMEADDGANLTASASADSLTGTAPLTGAAPHSTARRTSAPLPVLDESAAFARFASLAATEARPQLRALLDAAAARQLPYLTDDRS